MVCPSTIFCIWPCLTPQQNYTVCASTTVCICRLAQLPRKTVRYVHQPRCVYLALPNSPAESHLVIKVLFKGLTWQFTPLLAVPRLHSTGNSLLFRMYPGCTHLGIHSSSGCLRLHTRALPATFCLSRHLEKWLRVLARQELVIIQ